MANILSAEAIADIKSKLTEGMNLRLASCVNVVEYNGAITAFNTQSEALKAAISGMKSSSGVTLDTSAFEAQVKAQAAAIQKLIDALGTQPKALPEKDGNKPVAGAEQKATETDKAKPMREALLKQLEMLKRIEGMLGDPKVLKAELDKGALESMVANMKEALAPYQEVKPKASNKEQLEQLIEKLNEAVQENGTEKDKKDVAEIQMMLKAMFEINDDQKLAKALNATLGIKVEETTGPESLNERKGGWAEKFNPSVVAGGNVNISVNSTGTEVGDDPAEKDAHKSESVVGKKVDHQHDVINQQIKADQAAIEARVKADAAEKLAAAVKKEADAQENLKKAKKNQARYQNGVDKGKVGLVSVVAGVATFMAMVFVNPIAAAALAVVAIVSVMGGAVALHGEGRESANLKVNRAQRDLKEASAEKGNAENAAKGSQKDKVITGEFAKRLETERTIAEKEAGTGAARAS